MPNSQDQNIQILEYANEIVSMATRTKTTTTKQK